MTRKHYRTLAKELGLTLALTESPREREIARCAIRAVKHTCAIENPRFCGETFEAAITEAETRNRRSGSQF